MLLDTLTDNLEANDSIFMPNMPGLSSQEINYQEHDLDPEGYRTENIQSSHHEQSDLQTCVSQCTYLSLEQQQQLFHLISCFPTLFDSKLRTFKGPPIHVELESNPVLVCL